MPDLSAASPSSPPARGRVTLGPVPSEIPVIPLPGVIGGVSFVISSDGRTLHDFAATSEVSIAHGICLRDRDR